MILHVDFCLICCVLVAMCFSCLRFSFGGAGLNRRWGGYLTSIRR
ncbi:hypothetical protein NC651_000271 [Populus alba x Populus x berolinensis]|nr:hypothetical protein NC651_000271 [Populus alba x Populus x berolinensis]